MQFKAWLYAGALSVGMCGAASAQISGSVTLVGNPPDMPEIKAMASVPLCAALHKDPVYEDTVLVGDQGQLQNVIVFIKPAEGQKLTGPQITKSAEIDQKGCMYSPHVLAVEVGQPVDVKNSDGFLHNVHALSIDNAAFNFAQVTVSDKQIKPFTVPETFQIKCDVHPWMKAVIRVFDNPFFAVTGEDGKYTIDTKGLPDGTYTVQAWHEVYHDSAPQQVEIKGGKAAKAVDFKYQAKSGKAQAKPLNAIHLASATMDACCQPTKVANAK